MKTIMLFCLLLFFSSFSYSKQLYFLQAVLLVLLAGKPVPCVDDIFSKILKETRLDEVDDTTFKQIVGGVVACNTTMAQHRTVLLDSFAQFKDVPGYRHTVWQILAHHKNKGLVKGHMFEIEHALLLHKEGHTIKEFNALITLNGQTREFDVVTETNYWECKNTNWRNRKKKLKKQLSSQAQLVIALQQQQREGCSASFSIASRRNIPSGMQAWLKAEKIHYRDGLKSHLDTCTHH